MAREAVEALGHRLSDVVSWATTEQRQVLHIAAVVACNFSNYLIGRAERLLEAEGLSPKALLPLLDEMNDKLHQLPAVELRRVLRSVEMPRRCSGTVSTSRRMERRT